MGGPGSDTLLGGAGPDALHAVDRVANNDTMAGGAGRDSCRGDRGDAKSSC
jgi:Ca2+-binding RTX toxin-like protein